MDSQLGDMKMKTILYVMLVGLPLASGMCFAGFDEGLTAANKGDFATAILNWRPLAEQGNARAQLILGAMYADGQGVPQDYKEAVVWFRKAADQGFARAQFSLGVMYANGQGVPQLKVVAYALYNLSAASDPSEENNAPRNRTKTADLMTTKEITAAQDLTREMAKQGNLLKALDGYIKKPTIKEKVVARAPDLDSPSTAAASDPYPARPAKVPGRVSCSTRCMNADCYRTYDTGRKIRFQAKQKWNPFNNSFEWDSGSC